MNNNTFPPPPGSRCLPPVYEDPASQVGPTKSCLHLHQQRPPVQRSSSLGLSRITSGVSMTVLWSHTFTIPTGSPFVTATPAARRRAGKDRSCRSKAEHPTQRQAPYVVPERSRERAVPLRHAVGVVEREAGREQRRHDALPDRSTLTPSSEHT